MMAGSEVCVRDFAVEQCSTLLTRFVFELHNAAQRRDEESIHDLRVSIRRLQQAFRAFAVFLPQKAVKRIRKQLKKIMNVAAETRDRDIALQLFDKAGLAGESALRAQFEEERRLAEARMRQVILSLDAQEYSARWRVSLGLVAAAGVR